MLKCYSFLLLGLLVGCSSPSESRKEFPSQSDSSINKVQADNLQYGVVDTTINIGSGFQIQYSANENKGNCLLVVKHNNKQIYADTGNVYVLDDSLNPTLITLENGLFEIFLEVDDRPNKNYLKKLKVKSDNIIDSPKMPAFRNKPCYLFGDSLLVYADTWSYPEAWRDSQNRDLVTCDPIMYYVLTREGLVLDTAKTVRKNKEIFGIADVFKQTELKSLPINKMGGRDTEIKRIKNCK